MSLTQPAEHVLRHWSVHWRWCAAGNNQSRQSVVLQNPICRAMGLANASHDRCLVHARVTGKLTM